MAKSNSNPSRIASIDQYRGLAILLMVLANYLAGIESVPAFLKHAPDIGLTVIDLIAPFFIFALGLTYKMSWQRHKQRSGKLRAYQHFATRFLAIAGIGAIFSAGELWLNVDQVTVNWGVLQAIGAAGILTLVVIDLPAAWRAVIGLLMLAVYEYMLNTYWLQSVLAAPHGGFPGSISWGGMMILATVLAEFFHDPQKRKYFLPGSLLPLIAGIALAFIFPISKNRVSATYDLVSLGASGLLFALIHWLADVRKIQSRWLDAWGRNPLLLYVLHQILLGIVVIPGIPGWYVQAPVWLVAFQIAALITILSLIALRLYRRGIIISL